MLKIATAFPSKVEKVPSTRRHPPSDQSRSWRNTDTAIFAMASTDLPTIAGFKVRCGVATIFANFLRPRELQVRSLSLKLLANLLFNRCIQPRPAPSTDVRCQRLAGQNILHCFRHQSSSFNEHRTFPARSKCGLTGGICARNQTNPPVRELLLSVLLHEGFRPLDSRR